MSDLTKAARQYRHNCGDHFLTGYDKDLTEELVKELQAQIDFKIKECQELAQACQMWKKRALDKEGK